MTGQAFVIVIFVMILWWQWRCKKLEMRALGHRSVILLHPKTDPSKQKHEFFITAQSQASVVFLRKYRSHWHLHISASTLCHRPPNTMAWWHHEKLVPLLTRSTVAMGRLEMALRILVNEGCWGRGREGKQIKVPFAVCLLDILRAKFCCVIGLLSIGGLPVAPCSRTPHSGGHWRVCWMNRGSPTRPLCRPCEQIAASHIQSLRKANDAGQKEKGDSLVEADLSSK